MIKLLLECKGNKHVINQDGSMTLDLVEQRLNNGESFRIMGYCFIQDVSTFNNKWQKKDSKMCDRGVISNFSRYR
ncbi:hypothetical protein REPUB_Repub11eG0120300 [Reevesia pubescens]